MRGLDLESTRTLLDKLHRELRGLSNRAAALADESPPELGDALGYLATDIDRLVGDRRGAAVPRGHRFVPRSTQAKGNSKMTTR